MYDWLELQPKVRFCVLETPVLAMFSLLAQILTFSAQVELHRHLEGSIPFRTLDKFYAYNATNPIFKHMKPKYSSVEELRRDVSVATPMKDLAEVLDRLNVFQHAFVSVNAVREITLASILHAYQEESICKLEFRFSPEYMAEPAGLDWDQVMGAMVEAKTAVEALLGRDRLQVGFIAIASRRYGGASAMRTVEFARRWKKYIIGFDLADLEDAVPPEDFVSSIHTAKDIGLGITVHSGEGTSAKNIEKVIDLYRPHRLGHATCLIDNPALMEKVKQLDICVEACPTSNLITRCVSSYSAHPLMTYLRAGIPVTVNSDDPMLFDTDMRREWLLVMDQMGASAADMIAMNETAHKHSFLKEDDI